MNTKKVFARNLNQLQLMLEKVPEHCFELALSENMFSLAVNAQIAANFVLRGYCPLLNMPIIDLNSATPNKAEILKQVKLTANTLQNLPEVSVLQHDLFVSEKAGFTHINLPQPEFIHAYILPNMYFHMSMVYAIARANAVALSKGDFDGWHQYPPHFTFIGNNAP